MTSRSSNNNDSLIEDTACTWTIEPSIVSMRTNNPIRNIVDKLNEKDLNPHKTKISLSIGDPTIYGKDFQTDQQVTESVIETLKENKCNGYANSMGREDARDALAKKFSLLNHTLTKQDVILTSGCSNALDLCITVLCNEGDEILLPQPGFSLYTTLVESKGIKAKYYPLLEDSNWEINLNELRKLINPYKTKALLINNPSNPCGSVFNELHLKEILKIAEEFHLPIIADEIYNGLTFNNNFIPIAELTNIVPVLSVGGMAKNYLVPGWRVGWILIYDKCHHLFKVRDGLQRLTTLILGPNTPIQGALPKILLNYDFTNFFKKINLLLKDAANYTFERVNEMKGLKVLKPEGAMYCMIGINMERFGFKDDIEFCKELMKEESLIVLPGQCFRMKNYFRIVTCVPLEVLKEAFDRLNDFCERHYKE
ncbi:hypothetical protein ABK040_011290 [Willaertia magna]